MADSAFYREENRPQLSGLRWTRAPIMLHNTSELVSQLSESALQGTSLKVNRVATPCGTWAEVPQRWLVVENQERSKRALSIWTKL